MKRWEYKVIDLTRRGMSIPSELEESELNSLGNRGWELIGVTGNHQGYNGASARAYLKRLKQH